MKVETIKTLNYVLRVLVNLELAPNRIATKVEDDVESIVICFINGDRYADIEVYDDGEVLAGTNSTEYPIINLKERSVVTAVRFIKIHLKLNNDNNNN